MVQDWAKRIDSINRFLADTDYLILDIRNNRGGLGANAQYIASRFISRESDFMITQTKNGPGRNDFTKAVNWTIQAAGSRYTKPIILLTDMTTSDDPAAQLNYALSLIP